MLKSRPVEVFFSCQPITGWSQQRRSSSQRAGRHLQRFNVRLFLKRDFLCLDPLNVVLISVRDAPKDYIAAVSQLSALAIYWTNLKTFGKDEPFAHVKLKTPEFFLEQNGTLAKTRHLISSGPVWWKRVNKWHLCRLTDDGTVLCTYVCCCCSGQWHWTSQCFFLTVRAAA